jgi:hypothetical protein
MSKRCRSPDCRPALTLELEHVRAAAPTVKIGLAQGEQKCCSQAN